MAIYWLLLVFPAIGQLVHSYLPEQTNRIAWSSLIFIWAILIGLRHSVGCDWEPYAGFYQSIVHLLELRDGYMAGLHPVPGATWPSSPQSLAQDKFFWATIIGSIDNWDLSYTAVNLFAALTGTGIYGVNLVCGLLIVFGLSAFCRQMPLPWLAWLTATPYFLTVVSLGYTRQGAAIGLILWAIASLKKKNIWLYLLFALLAVSFHKWAVLVAFIGISSLVPKRYQLPVSTLTLFGILALGSFVYLIQTGSNSFHFPTFHFEQKSIGSGLRILLTAFTGTMFLLFWSIKKEIFDNSVVWVAFSCLSIVSFGLLIFGLNTASLDRFTLYLSPLQFYFWSHVPLYFSNGMARKLAVGLVILSYSSIMIIWFNLAPHAHCWVPYQSILFPS